MSWNDVDKPSNSGGNIGRFISFEDNTPVRMRILDEEPFTTRVHKISQTVTKGGKSEEVYRSIPATESPDDSYILKNNPKRYPEVQQFNMRAHVYVKDESGKETDSGETKVLQGGPAIFKRLRDIYNTEGSLTGFDVIITRKGSGRDTEYTVTAAARSRSVNVDALISEMKKDADLQWNRIFMPITAEGQKKIVDEAGMDIHYDPASALANTMPVERAKDMVMSFGKYKGKTVEELMVIDASYLEWAGENVTTNDELAAACRVMVKHMTQLTSGSEPKKLEKAETPQAAAKKEEAPAPAKEAPKAEAPKADTTEDRAEVTGKIQDWFESDPRFEDVQEVIGLLKKHGEGKTRLRDLTVPQLKNLLNEIATTGSNS